jgi:hypothetical protein
MWSLNLRGGAPNKPCGEYEKFQLVAEELLANVDETTSLQQFEQAQKGLLFYWQELKKRLDPLHPRFPGGHLCLDDAYLEYAMKLRTRADLQKPLPPPAQKPQPVPLETLLANVEELIAESTKETSFGHEREEERG